MASRNRQQSAGAKVGDTLKLDAPGLMRLPDGTVVTCRAEYTVRHAGKHVLTVTRDGKTAETTVDVAAREKD